MKPLQPSAKTAVITASETKTMNTMKTMTKPEALITSSLIILIISIFVILFLSGCVYERIEGNYDLDTENRTEEPFTEIISNGSFRVFVIPDSVTSISVKAESNILPYLYTISDGETLRIGFKNGYNIHENYPVEVFIHTPSVKSLRLQGSGRVECLGFSESSVELDLSGSGNIEADFEAIHVDAAISGSGNIHLSGSADNSDMRISGSGKIHALDFTQKNCNAFVSGSGDIYTDVIDQLDAHISGSGCVYYTGDPDVDTNITGSGKVRRY
ncbi:MAG: DUF2807 domain-containing protein [Bacteroidales bacterium]|nr:DUF2807 domain-containing protein [Bacteroidales bacterium]